MSSHTEKNHENADPFDPKTLRQIVPSTLGDKGTRALVCCIRNPEATTGQVTEKCGLDSTYTVENALRSAVQDADRDSANPQQVAERRGGEVREPETYSELTDKQRAVIDMHAEAPEWCADHSYSDIAQAIGEREDLVVSETYVGKIRRAHADILHRQRALAASEAETEVDLSDALSDMTVREVLEAAGFDLPDGNLDSMPVPDTEQAQATLGDARDASSEFETASEMAEQDGGSEYTPLSDAWREAHSGVPGAEQAQRLPDSAEDEAVGGSPYWAYVNGIASYGVFVSLTNPPTPENDVSGLVKNERLHGTPSEYERGDPMVVEFRQENPNGLEFTDWRIAHPNWDEQDGQEQAENSEGHTADGEQDGEQDAPAAENSTLAAVADDETLAALDERVQNQAEQMEVLADHIDTLREDAVMASEMQEMAERVEESLADLREAQADHEDEMWQALENSVGRQVVAQAEQAQERVDTLQDMVNALAEQVDQVASASGGLGRAQQALGRLEAEGAEVGTYEYSEQEGTVTLHVEATVDRTRQASLPETAQEGDN